MFVVTICHNFYVFFLGNPSRITFTRLTERSSKITSKDWRRRASTTGSPKEMAQGTVEVEIWQSNTVDRRLTVKMNSWEQQRDVHGRIFVKAKAVSLRMNCERRRKNSQKPRKRQRRGRIQRVEFESQNVHSRSLAWTCFTHRHCSAHRTRQLEIVYHQLPVVLMNIYQLTLERWYTKNSSTRHQLKHHTH